jgi:hypothetical protein
MQTAIDVTLFALSWHELKPCLPLHDALVMQSSIRGRPKSLHCLQLRGAISDLFARH